MIAIVSSMHVMVLAASILTATSFVSRPLPTRVTTTSLAPNRNKVHYFDEFKATLAPVEGSTETKQSKKPSFEKFDYNNFWYPVIWARDLPLDRPTRVTVFDTDYVVARTRHDDKDQVMCMLDRCPHKSASLSEGRVTSSGYFQCAYHGWSFDGKTGQCLEIPQTVTDETIQQPEKQKISQRACGTAVPAMVVQGMVWIFPGGNLERALQAPPPPVIDEMDTEGYKTVQEVRDFPLDWTILLENIMDPDHGLFAHGAEPFDLYCASKDRPQQIEEHETHDGKGWTITARVDAMKKITALDKALRRGNDNKTKAQDSAKDKVVPLATTTFTAPTHVVMSRRDKETDETKFLTAFWICPVGTGRSRFLAAAIAKAPFLPPRWFMNLNLNNFLDQDSHLLATQQSHVLAEEAKIVRNLQKKDEPLEEQSTHLRKSLFVYQSPTERFGVRIGALWDATLNRAPKRVSTLLDMDSSGEFKSHPSREVVLDRYVQHTQICPDSQDVVRNCNRIQKTTKTLSLFLLAAKAWAIMAIQAATASSSPASWAMRLNRVLKPSVLGWTLGVCTVASWLAKRVRREFFYKYTEAFRDRDMDNVPKHWADKE